MYSSMSISTSRNDILEYENRVRVQINRSVHIQKGNNRIDRKKSWALKSVESGITFDLQPLIKSREEALGEKLACDVKKIH